MKSMPISLPPDERASLKSLIADPATASRLATRAKIILALAEGGSRKEAASTVGVSPPTVSLWRRRYLDQGIAGLEDHQEESAVNPELERLLDAAVRTMSKRGFCATRVADIAEEAGITAPTVIYHFRTRQEILVQAMLHASRRSAEELEEQLAAGPDDPLLRLALFLRRVLPEAGRQRDEALLELDLLAHVRGYPELLPLWETYQERWVGELAGIIEDGVASGDFATMRPADELSDLIIAVVDGLGYQLAAGAARMSGSRLREIVGHLLENQLQISPARVATLWE